MRRGQGDYNPIVGGTVIQPANNKSLPRTRERLKEYPTSLELELRGREMRGKELCG